MKSLKEIFDEKSCAISSLRNWQIKFSDLWQKYINADLVGVRTPTGTGKTLVGLLILEQGLKDERGKKRGVYLTHTHQLMDRIGEEAKKLEVPYIILGGARDIKGEEYEKRKTQIFEYNRYKHIIISNYNAFLTTKDFPDNIEYLVIDDIDLFYNTLRKYYSVKIGNSGLTKDVYNQIIEALSSRDYRIIKKINEKTAKIDDADIIFPQDYDVIEKIIRDNISILNEDSNFKFPYEISREYIDFYYWYINKDELSIEPYIFPINLLKTPESNINRFQNIQKIILLSATLGQRERFMIELGLISKQPQLIYELDFNEHDIRMGEKLIFPITDFELSEAHPISNDFINITFDYLKDLILIFNKILILCWQNIEKGRIIHFISNNIDNIKIFDFKGRNYEIIEEFSNYPDNKKSCLIIANRYFGLDFPSSACQVCVLTRLPTYLRNYDIFIRNFLNDQNYYNELLKRRIVQSIGRLNRDQSDIALYFFLDPRFSNALIQATSFYPTLDGEIKEILEFSYKNASNGLFNDSKELGKRFLENKNGIKDELINLLLPIRENREKAIPNPVLEEIYIDEIMGWKYLYENTYDLAVERFEKIINILSRKRREPEYKSKIEWYNYILYLIYYKREKLGDKSKLKELNSYFKKIKKSEYLTWLNKIELFHTEIIKKRKIEEEISPSKAQELFKNYATNPELYLGDLIILGEIKKSLNIIKESLKNLGDKQIASPIRNLAIEFENICKNILEKRRSDIYERLKVKKKLGIAEILKALKGSNYIRKSSFAKLDSEPRNLRNIIVHIKEELPEYSEAIDYCNKLKEGICVLLKDVYFSDMLRASKSIADSFRSIESYEYLNDQEIKSRITEIWQKEKLEFEPKIEDGFNFSSYSGKVKLKSEGNEYEIDIQLDM